MKTKILSRFVLSLIATLVLPLAAQASEEALGASMETSAQALTLPNGYRCPLSILLRTPKQVIQDHQAALLAGDIDRAMCDYAPTARVLTADGVNVGRAAIRAGFEAMAGLFGSLPTTTGVFDTGPTVMVTWEIHTPFASIPDGVDTFVILFGQIHYQTVHARIHFN